MSRSLELGWRRIWMSMGKGGAVRAWLSSWVQDLCKVLEKEVLGCVGHSWLNFCTSCPLSNSDIAATNVFAHLGVELCCMNGVRSKVNC